LAAPASRVPHEIRLG
jgi:DNA-binding transcriptional regulator PaaX